MLSFGKTSAVAVAATSYLAQHYGKGQISSSEIARERNLTLPHVAKVLTRLSALGWIEGTRGAGGGYRLAKHPSEISLFDIIAPFEQSRSSLVCPFGPGWCGVKDPCPMHDSMVQLQQSNEQALRTMTLEAFLP